MYDAQQEVCKMGKSHVTLSVDNDILINAKLKNINLSELFTESLKSQLHFFEADFNNYNLQLKEKELKQKLDKIRLMQIEANTLRDEVQKYRDIQQQQLEEQLQKQKDAVDKANTCLVCKSLIPEKHKKHRLAQGYVCDNCFMTTNPFELNKYNKEVII